MSEPTQTPPPGTLVLLVRHGQTPTTGRVLPGQAPGLHLSDAGRTQAETLATRLDGLHLDALYASPLERAQETAAPTASARGLDVRIEPDLIECDFGDWTGRELADLAKLPEWDAVQRTPATFRFPGGESLAELQQRTVAAIERLRDAHAGGSIACFSHADPIRAALVHYLGSPLDAFQRVTVGTASVSALWFPAPSDADPRPAPSVLTVNSMADPLTGLWPAR